MKKFIHALLFINIFFSTECIYATCTASRSITNPTTIGTFSYSSTLLKYGLIDAPITLVQSPGIKAYVCQTPISISPGMMSIAMQINNRFGSRFCNHHHGQLTLQLIGSYLYNLYFNKWSTYDIPSLQSESTSIAMTSTSSGIIVSIKCPTIYMSNTFVLLKTILTDIYSTFITDTAFDLVCTTLYNDILSSITTATNPSGTAVVNHDILLFTQIQPKWDCSHAFGSQSIGGMFGVPVGSYESYSLSKLTIMKGSQLDKNRAKLCLKLFKNEKDLTFFIASSDISITSHVPSCIKIISDAFNLVQITALNTTYSGFAVPKGSSYTFQREGTDNPTGGTLFLGPISAYTMIASELVLKLITDSLVTENAYTDYIGAVILPIAGQMTVRTSSHLNSATPPTSSWDNLIYNIKSRYANNNNITDFSTSNFQNIINTVFNKLIPSTSHPIDQGLIDSVLTYDNDGYVNWMCLFHGSFKSFSDLYALINGTSADKISALTFAASILTTQADLSITAKVMYSTT